MKLLLLSFVLLSFTVVLSLAFAQEAVTVATSPSPSPVEYELPFPGILPDHPLYLFKRIRDTILIFLITNPLRKTEFYILLADKHLNMGIFLIEKNKPDLAVKTIVKGVGYLKQAENFIFEIPAENNLQIANLKHQLEGSIRKQQEIAQNLKDRLTDTNRDLLEKSAEDLNLLLQEFNRKK